MLLWKLVNTDQLWNKPNLCELSQGWRVESIRAWSTVGYRRWTLSLFMFYSSAILCINKIKKYTKLYILTKKNPKQYALNFISAHSTWINSFYCVYWNTEFSKSKKNCYLSQRKHSFYCMTSDTNVVTIT